VRSASKSEVQMWEFVYVSCEAEIDMGCLLTTGEAGLPDHGPVGDLTQDCPALRRPDPVGRQLGVLFF
jgi:hypothetical protein